MFVAWTCWEDVTALHKPPIWITKGLLLKEEKVKKARPSAKQKCTSALLAGTHLFLLVSLECFLFPAVVVGHGDDGQDQVDQVERTHEDDDDKERHVMRRVRLDYLSHATTLHDVRYVGLHIPSAQVR